MDRETMRLAILSAAEEWRQDAERADAVRGAARPGKPGDIGRARARKSLRKQAKEILSGGKTGDGKGGHGNTRLPYGLCKKYGIDVPPGTTPREAWELLKGKGVNPKEEYRKLKERGEKKERSGKKEPEGSKGEKEAPAIVPWKKAKKGKNPWSAPKWEGTAKETLRKHYNGDGENDETHAWTLFQLLYAGDTEKGLAEGGDFAARAESLIRLNAGWRGGPRVRAEFIPKERIAKLRRGASLSFGETLLWKKDPGEAGASLPPGLPPEGSVRCIFHCDGQSRGMPLPGGDVLVSDAAEYEIAGLLQDGDGVYHVYLTEKNPAKSSGNTYADAGDVVPHTMKPERFRTVADAEGYLFHDLGCDKGGSWDRLCADAKKRIAEAVMALEGDEAAYGGLDLRRNGRNRIALDDGMENADRSIMAITTCRLYGPTCGISFHRYWHGNPNTYRYMEGRMVELLEKKYFMPFAKGMESYYCTAHEYGHCVQQRILREKGFGEAAMAAGMAAEREARVKGGDTPAARRRYEDIKKHEEELRRTKSAETLQGMRQRGTLKEYASYEEYLEAEGWRYEPEAFRKAGGGWAGLAAVIGGKKAERAFLTWAEAYRNAYKGAKKVPQPDSWDEAVSMYSQAAVKQYADARVKEMKDEILQIAREIEPGCEPEKLLKDGGCLSEYGSENPLEFFAECFANSVCGAPNVLGRAMAVFLERCC